MIKIINWFKNLFEKKYKIKVEPWAGDDKYFIYYKSFLFWKKLIINEKYLVEKGNGLKFSYWESKNNPSNHWDHNFYTKEDAQKALILMIEKERDNLKQSKIYNKKDIDDLLLIKDIV